MGGDVVDEISVTVVLFKKNKKKRQRLDCSQLIVLDFIVDGWTYVIGVHDDVYAVARATRAGQHAPNADVRTQLIRFPSFANSRVNGSASNQIWAQRERGESHRELATKLLCVSQSFFKSGWSACCGRELSPLFNPVLLI